jgi:hypothetical protein
VAEVFGKLAKDIAIDFGASSGNINSQLNLVLGHYRGGDYQSETDNE